MKSGETTLTEWANKPMKKPEKWKWILIKYFEYRYKISSWGRVRSFYGGKVRDMAITTHKMGHKKITLYMENKTTTVLISRLVGFAFIPNPLGHPSLLHLDRDRGNAYEENLKWATVSEISRYDDRHIENGVNRRRPVNQLTIEGCLVKRWEGPQKQ